MMKYHPRFGHVYMPSMKLRVQGVSGGYLVRTNAAGFRSDREFGLEHDPGVFRVLLFGDSQTAGDGTANALRYSDLLEACVPGLEVDNYAISGTATDQQYLTYQEHANSPHDLVVIGLYVENIRRITRRVVQARDASGAEVFRAKPYFELKQGSLTLHNTPVPKQAWTEATLPDELRPHVYSYGEANYFFRRQSRRHEMVMRLFARLGPLRRMAKRLLTRFRKFQPLPDYDKCDTPGWLLLRAILKSWISESRTPVLIVPLPHDSSLARLSDPAKYQERFREIAEETGCQLYDPLPALLQLPTVERQALWSDAYGHLSVQGHAAIARLLVPVLERLRKGLAHGRAGG
jgi:lysophospholipase L1-like esterase